jgi:hypothetical protein
MARTFEDLYAWELSKQRESKFNTTVIVTFGVVAVPLAIFHHPAWLIVSVLAFLARWFHRWMHGGDHDLTAPAAQRAVEFMLTVRENNHAKMMLPLASAVTIINLAHSESCEFEEDRAGARIARNLRFGCAHCDMRADEAAVGAWWAAKKAFKPWAARANYLRPDGTCAKCGNSEGWFEAHF